MAGPKKLTLDLSKKRSNEIVDYLTAEYGYMAIYDITGTISIRFNEKDGDLFEISNETEFIPGSENKIKKLYITNSAQGSDKYAKIIFMEKKGDESVGFRTINKATQLVEVTDTTALTSGELNINGSTQNLGTEINSNNAGLMESSDFTETRNIIEVGGTTQTAADWTTLFQNLSNLDINLSSIQKNSADFTIDSIDVNSSPYNSSETNVKRSQEVGYGLSGQGGFTLNIKWTNGVGTVLDTDSVSSADGSRISGTVAVKSSNVIVEVVDDSGASNVVDGTVNIH